MEYEKLLENAYGKIKKVESSSTRFEIPKAEGHFEGRKTIISNFCFTIPVWSGKCAVL